MPTIVASRGMEQVIEKVRKVARTDSTVLIAGESGVGKELIARAVHHYSPGADKPAALPGSPAVLADIDVSGHPLIDIALGPCAAARAGDALHGGAL